MTWERFAVVAVELAQFLAASGGGLVLVCVAVIVVGMRTTNDTQTRERLLFKLTALDRGGDVLALAAVILIEHFLVKDIVRGWRFALLGLGFAVIGLLWKWCVDVASQVESIHEIPRQADLTSEICGGHLWRAFVRLWIPAAACIIVKSLLLLASEVGWAR